MWMATKTGARDRTAERPSGHDNAMTGKWGEDVAVRFLQDNGWVVVGRRVRPCSRDQRCEIDVIVRSRDGQDLVFVEVKTHSARSDYALPLWGVDRRKKRALLRACVNWVMQEKWHGNFRFDVIQVYGRRTSPKPPEIDHFKNIPLFPAKWRFW